MRIVALVFSFLLYDEVKAQASEEEKKWTKIFKRFIRASCSTITSTCVNTLIGGNQLTDMVNDDSNYHYRMEWTNENNTTQTFEFEQENDPFTEANTTTSLTMALWGGNNILASDNLRPTFKKVRQKVFRWLNDKHNITQSQINSSGRRRRDGHDLTDDELDEEIDTSFDDFIGEINNLTDGSFNPVTVEFGKVLPTIATTAQPLLPTTTNADWSGCELPWNQLQDSQSCFRIFSPTDKNPTFAEAREGCAKESSHLVRIDTEAANNQIGRSRTDRIWIGAMDLGHEGDWTDTNDKEITFAKWTSGNPNNHDNKQHCATINYGQIGKWDDLDCNVRDIRHYACQYENECGARTHDCDMYADCTDTITSFTCQCKSGFEGDGKSCEDINECARGTHDCNVDTARCDNTLGSFTCTCNSPLLGDGKLCTVPCAKFHESYPTFNDGGESFPTGTFEVSNLATIETGSQQDGVTNWKPSGSWTDKISYVQLEPKCKLEAFNQNDFTKLIGSWRGSQNLQNGHEMLEGKENDKISSYTCSCSEESCDSYYMFGKDVPKGCQSPKCDVVTYSLTDSWRKKHGNLMKYGFAFNVAIPEEYWNKEGWSVLVRFNGVDVNSGSFQIWNANFFNFFRKSNAFEILIHQKHFTGNDLADKHSFLLIVDKMTMSDLPEFYFFTDRQKKHQCFDRSMHQRSTTNFHGAIESSSKTNTYEDVSFVAMTRTGEFRVRV